MGIWIAVGAVLLIAILFIAMYNGFVRADQRVKEAFSTMDVYLVKRWEMIPKLVETVKAYAGHEKEVFSGITKLRSGTYDSMTDTEKIEANAMMSKEIGRLMGVAEAYPELRSSENFIELGKALSGIEDEIANARKYYNGTVRLFNNKTETFPGNLFAKMFGFSAREMYEASAEERSNVSINL